MFWDFLTSTKRPDANTTALPGQQVRDHLMALNRPSAPWAVVDGRSEGVDLIAEWRIVDAQWYEVFAKAGLEKAFKISLKLDETTKEVRALDREYEISWSAGVPRMSLSAKAFKGQSTAIEFGAAYGFTENLSVGEIYNYRFATSEIKKPLQKAATDCGWTYKGVAFGKL